ncbi:MAG: hypothetical protein KDD66_07710 [Bdellovibrionales bacterium]|nr:hypothetical protein [Bdellovibrionales bacterium]
MTDWDEREEMARFLRTWADEPPLPHAALFFGAILLLSAAARQCGILCGRIEIDSGVTEPCIWITAAVGAVLLLVGKLTLRFVSQ